VHDDDKGDDDDEDDEEEEGVSDINDGVDDEQGSSGVVTDGVGVIFVS
jgi:hypothetical protein